MCIRDRYYPNLVVPKVNVIPYVKTSAGTLLDKEYWPLWQTSLKKINSRQKIYLDFLIWKQFSLNLTEFFTDRMKNDSNNLSKSV